MIVLGLEYGEDYHGPSEDIFREDRAATEPRYAHLSNFLHPVLYFYHVPPSKSRSYHLVLLLYYIFSKMYVGDKAK